MTMLSDRDIYDRCSGEDPVRPQMIFPFEAEPVRQLGIAGRKVISYGTSSYGYDMRLGYDFKIFSNLHSGRIDPKNFDEESCHPLTVHDRGLDGDSPVVIPPNSFALGVSIEYFRIPRDVVGICLGKSTYARCGIIVNITPLEPEWEGFLTIEISNTTPLPAVVYAGEGIAQVIFLRNYSGEKLDRICKTSYKDKGGKYQAQTGLTTARV